MADCAILRVLTFGDASAGFSMERNDSEYLFEVSYLYIWWRFQFP